MKASLALPRKRQRMEHPEDVGDTSCRHDALSTPTSKCSDTIVSTIPSMIYTISSKSPSTSFSDDQIDGNISKLKQKEIHSSPLDVMSLEQNLHSRKQNYHEVNYDSFKKDSFLHSNFDTSLLKHDDGNKYRNKANVYDQTQADVSIDLCRTSPISKESNLIDSNEYRIYSTYSNDNDSSHSSSSAIDYLLSFDSNSTPILKHNTTFDSTQNDLKSLEMTTSFKQSNPSVDTDSISFPSDENTNSNNAHDDNVRQSMPLMNRNDLRQPTFESGVSYDDTFDEENDPGTLLSGLSISSNLESDEASLHALRSSEKDTRIGHVCQTEVECTFQCEVKDLSYISNLHSDSFTEKNESDEDLRKHCLKVMKMNSEIALSNAEAMRKTIASLHNSLDPTIIPDESCYSFFHSKFIKLPNIHHIESLTCDEYERMEFTGSVTSDCFSPYIYEEERYISNVVEINCANMRDIVLSHLRSFQQDHCESFVQTENRWYKRFIPKLNPFNSDSTIETDPYFDKSIVIRDGDLKVRNHSELSNLNPNGQLNPISTSKAVEVDVRFDSINVLNPMMEQEGSEMQLPQRIRFILSFIFLIKCLVIVHHLESYFISNNLHLEQSIHMPQPDINAEDLTEDVIENTFAFVAQLSKICVISTTNTLL